MSDNLPTFRHVSQAVAVDFIGTVLRYPNSDDDETALQDLIRHSDGHFRAIFAADYFNDPPPSKSQWSTLKKKVKRHNQQVFVFKDVGEVECELGKCYYIDFGFFLNY